MKKIFIDCGAHNGCSTKKFLRVIPGAAEYEIHCFEPSPRIDQLAGGSNIHIHKAAVSTHDGTIRFYGDWTIVQGIKKSKGPDKDVPCVDISRWIQDNACLNDHVILKMDIEGAEYDIIQKMHKDGTLTCVDELWIELHSYKYKKTWVDDKKLLDTVSYYKIPCYEWDALETETFDRTLCDKDFMMSLYKKWNKERGFQIPIDDIKW